MSNLQIEVERYLEGSAALFEVEDALADAFLDSNSSPAELEAAGAVHVAIAGLANGSLSQENFETELANAFRPSGVGKLYTKERTPDALASDFRP